MTTPLTIVYKCDDGTDFPVVWNSLEDSEHIWVQVNSHWPDAMKPFDAVAWLMGELRATRAFEEADIPVQMLFRPHLVPNGFLYVNRTPLSNEQQAIEDNKVQNFTNRMGGILSVWENFCQPRIEECCARIRASGAEVSTVELVDTLGYAFHMTMVSLKTMALVLKHLTDFLAEKLGAGVEILSVKLTAGGVNETLMADQVLWELAQLVRASDSLKKIVLATSLDQLIGVVSEVDQGHKFQMAFDDYLKRYGGRATRWESSYPTVRARVIMDLSDAPKFQPGEILVCVMTSPPWTILFTKAAAVVTETGAVLSHASIASREFGLPCVAAVQSVTTLIKDGMLITVDGTEGTVTIEE